LSIAQILNKTRHLTAPIRKFCEKQNLAYSCKR
jgi:hypothetical protein